jgi:glycosyltransferase involved in cell wall biosynthesis
MRTVQGSEYFITHIVPDGPEKYLGIPGPLAVALSINGHQNNSFLITCSTEDSESSTDSRITGKNVSILKKYQLGTKLATAISPELWFKVLNSNRNHIFHFHFSRSINSFVISLILMLQKREYLTQTHGSVLSTERLIIKIYDSLITRKLLRKSRMIIALQDDEAQHLIRIASQSIPIVTVRNSIQIRVVAQVRQPKKAVLVGFVGHLRAGNKPEIFIEIAKLLQNERDFEFIMIGADGGLGKKLKQEVQFSNLDNVRMVGHQDLDGLRRYYEEIDVIICPAKTAQAISFMDGISSGAMGITSRDNASWDFYLELGVKVLDNDAESYAEYLMSKAFREDLHSVERVNICAERLNEFSSENLAITWTKVYDDVNKLIMLSRKL